MFDQLVKRSNAVWVYSTGRFAEERRAFLCDLNERGHDLRTLRKPNGVLAQALSHPFSMALVDSQGVTSVGTPSFLCGNESKETCSERGAREARQHNRYPNIFACPCPRVRGPNPSILPTVAFHRRPTVPHDWQAPSETLSGSNSRHNGPGPTLAAGPRRCGDCGVRHGQDADFAGCGSDPRREPTFYGFGDGPT